MSTRRDFAGVAIRQEMGNQKWTHRNCMDVTEKLFGKGHGVARPGKTAHERSRKERKIAK
jgi:hypothetical protein